MRLKKLFLVLLSLIALTTPLLVSGAGLAADNPITDPICTNPEVVSLPKDKKPSVCQGDVDAAKDPNTFFGKEGLLAKVLNILSVVGAIAAVITIMIAGLRMIFSAGDSSTVANSRQAIIYACIGLVIIAFAQAIVQFVIYKLS